MSKTLIHDYTFIPSQNKIVVNGNIPARRFLIITNVTKGEIVYNFASPLLTATITYDPVAETTTVALVKNCSSMSSSDVLQILYEEDYIEFEPTEPFIDPVNKLRVSTPQNLVDTDFEYGPQSSKWETLQTLNNIPSFYAATADTTISFISKVESVSGNELITVTTTFDHGLLQGIPISVSGLTSASAEGSYLIQSVPNSKQFTYKARAAQPSTGELQGPYTSIIPGRFYQGSQVIVDSATGIVSDLYNRVVTVNSVRVLTLTATAPLDWVVGGVVSNGIGGSGIISQISGSTISVYSITGTFSQGDTLTSTGSVSATIATGGVGAAANKFFIDGVQQPSLNFSKQAIYVFDLSSSTLSGITFRLSTTSDGSNNSGTEYTTYVYKNGTPGSAGAYLRIYVTNTTPNLFYYSSTTAAMGGSAPVSTATSSKVYLTTAAEHGFSDNTNFYFVNTVSPKILSVSDPTATAPDGRPYVDASENITLAPTVDLSQTIPHNYESTYTLKFANSAVNYSNSYITISNHQLYTGYSLLYYPNPGDTPVGGLDRMQVYYVQRIDANTIRLWHDQSTSSYPVNLTNTGTFNYGSHSLALCYSVYQEYKAYGDYYGYYYTYYNSFGGTYSGHDLATVNSTYGLGQKPWDSVAFFSTNRNSTAYGNIGSSNFFYYNYAWYYAYSTYWRTYGYHLQSLPLTGGAQYQGAYDFIYDFENYGVNGNNDGGYSYGYTVGGYAGTTSKYYWTGSFYTYLTNSYLRLYGDNYYYWYLQGYYYSTLSRTFGSPSANNNMYFILLARNTSTNDSFYAANHGFVSNQAVTLTVSGGSVGYYYDTYGNVTTISSGTTVYIDYIDNNRFRIKSSTSSSPYRLAYATGTVLFSVIITNPTKNSVYIANNQFSNNELIKYIADGGTSIGGLTSGNSYYIKSINGNRFQLGTTSSFSTEVDITSTGTGNQTFENTTANFGVVDGSYTTTKAISETSLEVTLPFKIPPATKSFNANTNVVTGASGYITINNHYFSTGARVIYDAGGGTVLGGLTNGSDYFVIVLDNNNIRLASSLANAVAGIAVTITSKPGTSEIESLISPNLSGLVTGTGTVSVTSGTRIVTGTNTSFQRFFKIGDTLNIINNATTPGTIVTKTITAIASDTSLLVDSNYSFTGSGLAYQIPSYIYVRPDGFYLHRPFDGGMEIGTSRSPNAKICRQTRKYFRYQSGKGIQTSFAINFTPQIPIISVSYNPQGTQTVVSGSGSSGSVYITVSSNSGLIVDMPVTGTGIATGARISAINGNIITLTLPNIGTVSGNLTFGVVHYVNAAASKPHNLTKGLNVIVTGGTVSDFAGTWLVSTLTDDYNFRYILNSAPSQSSSSGFITASVKNWSDAFVRAGMFDDQNGFFYEYNGNTLNCVRRSSVLQLPGKISVTNSSNIVTGTSTSFTSQLTKGDSIVIRGMTYRVVKVTSNTRITIQPEYRGITASNVTCTKTVDTKVAQQNWSIDRCDGTGPSGFLLDVTKIQMCYMDYSWYGAGKIRYGFKDHAGHVRYVHEFKHNNRLTESYFRSGNLPARYEVENGNSPTYPPTLFHWGTSVIMDGTFQDDEAYLFTASGNLLKYTNSSSQTSTTNVNSTIVSERVNFSTRRYFLVLSFPSSEQSKLSPNTLIYNNTVANGYFLNGRAIDSRSYLSGSNWLVYIPYQEGTQTLFPNNYDTQINSNLGNPAVPSSTTFNVGSSSGSVNTIPTSIPLISIRLAPSVDSSLTGKLGQREIINRMQLKLNSVGILTTHETEISLILNGDLSTDSFENVTSPSLSQLVKHWPADTISSGQKILSFRAAGGSTDSSGKRLSNTTTFDLSDISALGNSIIGGDGVFPNGPDLLTVVADIVDSTGVSTTNPYTVTARVTWKESQA